MPIQISHSPVGTLMNLARSAGEGQQRREGAAHDLAFTQMALQAQTQNAQIAATMQRNDQAFQLQRAAMERQARTPTRAGAGRGPLVQEFDRTLGRMVTVRGWEQQDINTQLKQLEQISGISDARRETERLRIMAGRGPSPTLGREITEAEKPSEPPISTKEQITQWRNFWKQELDPLQKRVDRIVKEKLVTFNIRDAEGEIVPELQKEMENRQADLQRQLAAAQTELYRRKQLQKQEWATISRGPQPDIRTSEIKETPQPLPADRSQWVKEQVYRAPDGRIGRWTGEDFERVE